MYWLFSSQYCLIKAQHRSVTALGVEGLAIIETKNAVLVTQLDKEQSVKELVALLKGRGELTDQREAHGPWNNGSIDIGPNYQVKGISVNPGARLSLQRHQFRAEPWVVVGKPS